ncbi:MAG: hypothetical protein K0S74_158 [Chlamydiales bacterium]|jgi:hypothetical protein|nr:hypothetical protein [Chlamydiales bacterium]
MTYLKTIILTLFVLIITLTGWMLLKFDANYELKLAMESFLKADYTAAEQKLEKLKQTLPAARIYLYESYIALQQGDLLKQQDLLQQAFAQIDSIKEQELILEIQINKALNAFLQQKSEAMALPLQFILDVDPQNGYVQFLAGLRYYLQHQYEEALTIWQKTYQQKAFSPWMKRCFETIFTPNWRTLFQVRCYIEQGDTGQAKNLLEHMIAVSSHEETEQIQFLMGLNYLKEADGKPLAVALPYYQLAQSYFEKVALYQPKYQVDRQRIITLLENIAIQSLQQKHYSSMAFFTHALEKWESSSSIAKIAESLIIHLKEEVALGNSQNIQTLYLALKQTFIDDKLRKELGRDLSELAWHLVRERKIDSLDKAWDVVISFAPYPQDLTRKISEQIQAMILDICSSNTKGIVLETQPYISFLDRIEQNLKYRLTFALNWIATLGEFWNQDPNQASEALSLLKVAANFPQFSERNESNELAQNILKILYSHLQQKGSTEFLRINDTALNDFNLTSLKTTHWKSGDKALILKEANNYFIEKRFAVAAVLAQWVLRFNPYNEQAKLICGLSAYYQKEYVKCLTVLTDVNSKANEVLEAIGLSLVMTGQVDAGKLALAQLAQYAPISDRVYTEIGYREFSIGKYPESYQYFTRIKEKESSEVAMLCYLAYKLKQWDKVVAYFYQLPQLYQLIHELQIIAINSLNRIGKYDKALLIKETMQKENSPPDYALPTAFASFKNQYWTHIDLE